LPEKFEEWVAHPDHIAYVDVSKHSFYSGRPGWWVTDWVGTAADVKALGAHETLVVDVEDASGRKHKVVAVELVEVSE
jgi:hypothetical protein